MTKHSWKVVAKRLGERLSNASCSEHQPSTAETARDCPFCDDVMAYKMYLTRLAQDGEKPFDPFEGVQTIPWHEVATHNSASASKEDGTTETGEQK